LDWYLGDTWFGMASLTKLAQAVTLWNLGDAPFKYLPGDYYERDFLRFPVFQANLKLDHHYFVFIFKWDIPS
jgi:hypothetical protein